MERWRKPSSPSCQFCILGPVYTFCIVIGGRSRQLFPSFSTALSTQWRPWVGDWATGFPKRCGLEWPEGCSPTKRAWAPRPIAHGAADAKSPRVQGMWGIVEVFLDTILCCTLTTLVILTAEEGKLWRCGLDGAQLTHRLLWGGHGGPLWLFSGILHAVFCIGLYAGAGAFTARRHWNTCSPTVGEP